MQSLWINFAGAIRLDDGECPGRYYYDESTASCIHYLFPITLTTFIGSLLIAMIAGLSSIAGLGGGGPSLVVFLMFFDYLPKDANIVVFTSIFGATLGNSINQMRKSHNGQPLVQYRYAFVSLPVMFLGSFFGVYLNKLLPSAVICSIIVYQSVQSLPKIYNRFRDSHKKETQEILLHHQQANRNSMIKEEIISPFNQENNPIFINIILLVAVFTALLFIRGTEKIPSLIGIEPCSFLYWLALLVSLGVIALLGSRNFHHLTVMMAPSQSISDELKQADPSQISNLKREIVYYSGMAGVFSGFGLGGGLFLVPMYRCLGCSPLQATASTAFTILITSFINCIQGMFLGVIKLSDFAYFLAVAGGGSFLLSILISGYLRKLNRLSYVEGLLFILLLLACINIPLSLIAKYVNSGYDSAIILSFGSLC